MRGFFCAAALGALAAATPACAADGDASGFYIGVDAGIASLNDPVVTYSDVGGTFGGTGARDTATAQLKTDNAFTFGGVLGYDFGTVRTDLEVAYARNKIASLTFLTLNGKTVTLSAADRADVCDYLEADTCGGSGSTFAFDGSRARQLSAMGNLWLDVPAGGGFTPYVGGGLGISGFEIDGEGKGKFAWQLGAGAAIAVSPATALTFDFRHRQTSSTTIEDGTSTFSVDKLKTNTFTAGLRFTF
ncbi:outer membrane protein [Parablastomonas sp. CN1-191]|uniref:outer membrane protein n=1 Tax=Parablastomonas sp. CN1-191 TaxID=3400908 RepID=UPI003BF81F05